MPALSLPMPMPRLSLVVLIWIEVMPGEANEK